MQCAVIEAARDLCGMKGAQSTEFDPKTKYPVIDLLKEQRKVKQVGGSMRLGTYPCKIKKGTKAHHIYGRTLIHERHRHRYELNNRFRKQIESAGLRVSGEYAGKRLAEIVELKDHPWFVAVQFHPELQSRPLRPHPLFKHFVAASLAKAFAP
ncbi:MAG: hypothetical protein A3A86_03935 [Elusimicrobia bacterium RIFCSPLOWO2_01_FULL_60_11]|nr:MAG: hypothetical protein A3A86_03935 [Elusimicrobia bacterium RIFCSPLOWO2_01_FULL_60_11]